MVIVEFDHNDVELRQALVGAFGNQVDIVDSKGFDGGTAKIVQAILPTVSALTPLLVAYFARPQSPADTKRVVVTDKGELTLEGYSTDDVERLVERVRSGSQK
jgi:hypothetical protein